MSRMLQQPPIKLGGTDSPVLPAACAAYTALIKAGIMLPKSCSPAVGALAVRALHAELSFFCLHLESSQLTASRGNAQAERQHSML